MNGKIKLEKIKSEIIRLGSLVPKQSEDATYINTIILQMDDILLNKNYSDELIDSYCTFYNSLSIVLLTKILNAS